MNLPDEEILNHYHPIGCLYLSMIDTNPGELFGGTWERIAKGRTLVGVEEDDEDFAEAGLELGEKTHTLTTAELPSHTHTFTGTATSHTHTTKVKTSKSEASDYGLTTSTAFINRVMIEGTGTSTYNGVSASTTVTPKRYKQLCW